MIYEPHELSMAFPDMPLDQFQRLAKDIKANGLNHPIVLLEGKILDGRHRYKACREYGIAPRFREFHEGDADEFCHGDPVAYVQSENAARRQLSESQLAYAITHPNILEYEKRKARERLAEGQVAGGYAKHDSALVPTGTRADIGRVREKLAKKAGVGANTVHRAIAVREKGIPEIQKAVEAGDMSVNMAAKIVKLNPDAQKRIVEAPKGARSKELGAAINRSVSATIRSNRPVQPVEPSTPFVRKLLSGFERLTILCAESDMKDGADIAAKFIAEMEWGNVPLTMQLDRAEPIIRALAIIQQARVQKAA